MFGRESLYRGKAARSWLAKYEAPRKHVVQRPFSRRESGADAIDQKIVKAEGRDVRQESSAQKAAAGSREGNATAVAVRDIEAQHALSERCTPRRAFKSGKISPRKHDKETETDVKKPRPEPHKDFAGRHAGT